MSKDTIIRDYIYHVLEKDPCLTSKEIAEFLNTKGHKVSWQMVAGIRGKM